MNVLTTILLVIFILLILYYLYTLMTCSSTSSNKSKKIHQDMQIVILTCNNTNYDSETRKNIEETFFNLALLREIFDAEDSDTQKALIPSVLETLSKTVKKIEPLLATEKEIVATVRNTIFKIKKDGLGNICFGSPTYFVCLNPTTKELFPYVNDMLVVYHLMQMRSVENTRDPNVEKLLMNILRNIFPCKTNEELSIDFASKYDDLLLTKLFNSTLDTDLMSSLMMIILFSNENKIIDSLTMNNDGSFTVIKEATFDYLQKFSKMQLDTEISYKTMKHILYNICYSKYTVHGFSVITPDEEAKKSRKELIESTIAQPMCKIKSILKTSDENSEPKPKKTVTFA